MDVSAHQFVEMRVVFPRRLLTSTAGAKVVHGRGLARSSPRKRRADEKSYQDNQAQIDDAKHHWLRTAGYLALIGLAPALVIIGLIWLVFGRERKTDYDREYEQAPPTESQPALVPPLLRQSTEPGSLEFTATLFDLIRRGYYKSTPVTTEHSAWGGLKKEQVSDLELSSGDQSIDLEPWENSVAGVFNAVLATGPERLSNMRDRIEAERTENAKRFQTFKSRVETAMKAKRWFVGQGAVAIWIAIAGFIVAAVILIVIPGTRWRSGAPRWTDIVLLAVGICMVVNAAALLFAFLHAKVWRRRTKAGETEAERWQAFRRYLTDFPRLQDAPPATLQLWERFLVYGIAFGIAERVLQGAQLRMPQEFARPEHDLLDHAVRRPRLRRKLACHRRPLCGIRLGALTAELERLGRRLLGRRRRRRRGRWWRRLVRSSRRCWARTPCSTALIPSGAATRPRPAGSRGARTRSSCRGPSRRSRACSPGATSTTCR